jgi:hypothetical protein
MRQFASGFGVQAGMRLAGDWTRLGCAVILDLGDSISGIGKVTRD